MKLRHRKCLALKSQQSAPTQIGRAYSDTWDTLMSILQIKVTILTSCNDCSAGSSGNLKRRSVGELLLGLISIEIILSGRLPPRFDAYFFGEEANAMISG